MGLIGNIIGSEAGKHIGGYIGSKFGSDYKESGQNIGRVVGGAIGNFSPYHQGGPVNGGKKGKYIFIEKGEKEFVIPTKYVGDIPKGLKSKILKNKRKSRR